MASEANISILREGYLVSRDGVGVKGEIVSLFLRVGRGEEEAMRGGDSVWLQVVGDSDGRRLLQTEHSLSHGRVGGQGRVMVELLHYPLQMIGEMRQCIYIIIDLLTF